MGVYFGRSIGIAFGSTWDDLGSWGARERKIAIANVLQGTMFSSMVQQVQLPCPRFLSLLNHKIN
jgi:hypothetical protein